MSIYSDAYNTFRDAERAAALFDNPNWTRSAPHKERKTRLEAARTALLNTPPATTADGTAPGAEKAEEALRRLRPTSADAVAVTSNEWAKVEAHLRAGQNLARLIETADRETLVAVVDRMPTRLVSTSPEPADAIAEVHALAIARLAALGDTSAQAALAAQRTAAVAGPGGGCSSRSQRTTQWALTLPPCSTTSHRRSGRRPSGVRRPTR